jgi:hypothetical protein
MFKGLSSLLFLYYTFFTLLLGLAVSHCINVNSCLVERLYDEYEEPFCSTNGWLDG